MGIINRILMLFRGFNWLIIPASLFAIIFHEISHGFVAYLLGDRTAKESGRLSLNPIKHMDVVGLFCMILFGFGWAKPVPINPYYFKNKKFGISLVSIAGPLSNLIMAFLDFIFLMLCVLIPEGNAVLVFLKSLFAEFFVTSAILNIGLAVFNLIPIPPLDGSKILFALLPRRVYGFILRYERYGMLLLLVLINIPFFNEFITFIRDFIYLKMFNIIF